MVSGAGTPVTDGMERRLSAGVQGGGLRSHEQIFQPCAEDAIREEPGSGCNFLRLTASGAHLMEKRNGHFLQDNKAKQVRF